MDVFRTIFPEEYLATFLEHQVRPDGRTIDQVRKTAITTGSITTAYGSAMVKLGGTSIIGGVQAELVPCKALSQGDELADGGDDGDSDDGHDDSSGQQRGHDSDASLPQLVINVELPALCSPLFRPGKPSELQQSLCHRINTLAKAAKLLDTEELCVRSDRGSKLLVWCIIVDLYCLDNDGSLFDACVLALVASLRNTHLPIASLADDGSRVFATPERPIALAPKVNTNFLVPLSFAWINGKMLADPTADEEEQQQAGVTVIVLANSNVVCSADKYGGQAIPLELFTECIARTRERATEVVALLNKCA